MDFYSWTIMNNNQLNFEVAVWHALSKTQYGWTQILKLKWVYVLTTIHFGSSAKHK